MGHIVYFLVLAGLLSVPFLTLTAKEKYTYMLFIIFVFSFKYFLIIGNETYRIFEEKYAGNFAIYLYEIYAKGFIPDFEGNDFLLITFKVQTWVNYIPFKIFGANRYVLILTNSFFVCFAGVYAYFSLLKTYGRKTSLYALVLLNVLPVAINFSMFGLRDPIIYFLMTVNILSLIQLSRNFSLIHFSIIIATVAAFLSLRPEMLAFLGLPYFLVSKNYILNFYRKLRGFETKIFIYSVTFAIVVIPSIILVIFMYQKVINSIGILDFVSPAELASTYAENRYGRFETEGEGGGSNILPASIYYALPWYLRWLLQSLGIIILPFPWLVNNFSRAMAFFDSGFFIYMIYYYAKNNLKIGASNTQKIRTTLFITFVFGVLVMGILVSNSGNAFRMRLSIAPYLIIMFALFYSKET